MKHLLTLLAIITVSIPNSFATFNDTRDHDYREAIDQMVTLGVVQ